MAKEFYTVKVIPHLENETGEHDYAPMYEVQISPCPVCMRMIGNAGVDVVTSA